MPCFDTHVPVFKHKDAWAEERIALKTVNLEPNKNASVESLPRDILIVASKLKDYIRVKSGLNTSALVLERLSDIIRRECDKAIEHAKADNRKTVMDRDFI